MRSVYRAVRSSLPSLSLVLLLMVGLYAQVFSAEVTLTVWFSGTGLNKDIFLSLVERYNTLQNKVYVDAESMDYNKMLVAITGGMPPDLGQIAGEGVIDLARRGLLQPLPRYIQEHLMLKDIAPVKIKEATYNGLLYALPTYPIDINGSLVWNKEHFAVAGINPDLPPLTIKDLELYAAKLTKVNGEGRIMQAGFIPWNAVGSKPFTWGWRFGGDFYDYTTEKVTATHPKNIEAFTWLADYGMRYGLAAINEFNVRYGRYYAADSALFQGAESMQVLYSNTPGHARAFAPHLELGHGYLPAPEGQSLPFGWLGGWQMGIPIGAPHTAEAAEFLLWLMEPAQQQEWQKQGGFFLPRISANSLNLLPKESHFYVDMLLASQYYRPAIGPVNTYNNQLLAGLMDILAGKTTPVEMLTNIERNIQGQL
ncbi:MAG TPA: extracellular solute-binding protein [Firmicutes bacterium]|nr:extracellular solute-binding protein [Bacillota bacterium]